MNSQELSKCNIKSLRRLILILFVGLINSTFSLQAADYYWVGGTGNWSDYSNHWATSSGGNIFHTSIPSLNDNVFFDGNSASTGFYVAFDTTFIYCKNMEWTGLAGTVNVSGSNSTLNIFGSLKLHPDVTWNVKRINFLSSTGTNTIETAGKSLDTLYFEGQGHYDLSDSLNCKSIFIYSGSFKTNNHSITTPSLVAGKTGGNVSLDLGNSKIYCSKLFEAYYGTINMLSSNTELIFDNTFNTYADLWSAGMTFKNIYFHINGKIVGGVTCQKLIADHVFEAGSLQFPNYCQFVQLRGNSSLNWLFTADTLIIDPGVSLIIRELNINNYFSAQGNCSQLISIKQNINVTTGFINVATNSADINYTILSSINNTGTANLIANNSIDGGGNSGWTINSPASRTLFWVGGSGLWSDENNWSLTSGGVGGECLPTLIDDIFFDTNSFSQVNDTVKVDILASCKTMDWSMALNNPTLSLTNTSNKISLFGSLVLSSNMNIGPYITMDFVASDSGHTIFSDGNYIPKVYFNGIGSWTLLDSISSENISINKGTFYTNDNNINTESFRVQSGASADLGNSTLYTIVYTAYWPSATVISNNAKLVFNNGGQGLLYDAVFNEVLANQGASITGKLTCNRFESLSNVFVNQLKVGYSLFHQSFSFRKIEADTIILLPGVNKVNFDTLIVSDYLITSNDCNNPLHIQSYVNPQVILIKSSGIVNIDYVYLSGVVASGGAIFNATNSWDLGGSSGWNITPPVVRTLYWVGGGGNWNDPNHWASSSNGSPGNCAPFYTDSVMFDNSSFGQAGDTVYISPYLNVFIKNFEVNGVTDPTYLKQWSSPSNFVYIDGSIQISPELKTIGLSVILTSDLSGNVISCPGAYSSSIRIDGSGSWGLIDSLNSGGLRVNSGSLNSNGNMIATNQIHIKPAAIVDLDTSTVFTRVFSSETTNLISNNVNLTIINSIVMNYFESLNGDFNSITFNSATTVKNNFSTNELIAYDDILGDNSNITANYAEFKGNVTLPQSLTADTVIFNNPGKVVEINQLNVNNSLTANGNGGFPIQIEGINGAGTINKSSGFVCLDYVWLKDITATGGAQFFAGLNSVDLGGNSGWYFSVCSPVSNVWPGDANYDLVVDNNDILNIGLAFGYTGPVRTNASLAWIAQPAQDWAFQFANFANLKHADTDGNGM